MFNRRIVAGHPYLTLFFLYLVTRLVVLIFFSEYPSLFYNHYEAAALNFLNSGGFTVPYHNSLVPMTLYPPGYSFFIALIFGIVGEKIIVLQLVQVVMAAASFLLFFKVVEDLFRDKQKAFYFGIFYCLIPIFWTQDVSVNTGAPVAISLLFTGIYFLHRFFRYKSSSACFLSGLFLAAASAVRSEYAVFMMALFVLTVWKFRRNIKPASLMFASFLLVLAPLSIRNYDNFKVITPYPGGFGLALVNVIGKYYPSQEKGFAYGDENVLKAEKGNYEVLSYPEPYRREKARMSRAVSFIKERPLAFIKVLVFNLPRAWFGQSVGLAGKKANGLQKELGKGKGLFRIFMENSSKMIDVMAGIFCSLILFATFLYALFRKSIVLNDYLIFIIPAALLFLLFVPLGTLGRYVIPGYMMLSPVSYLGILKLKNRRREKAAA